jgi:hypothetical protein
MHLPFSRRRFLIGALAGWLAGLGRARALPVATADHPGAPPGTQDPRSGPLDSTSRTTRFRYETGKASAVVLSVSRYDAQGRCLSMTTSEAGTRDRPRFPRKKR